MGYTDVYSVYSNNNRLMVITFSKSLFIDILLKCTNTEQHPYTEKYLYGDIA